jgi:DNA-binding NtrC family response regulator
VIPALRERGNDIALLFRKFASDFAEKYRMPSIRLDEQAIQLLMSYRWPGNVRQLKNVTEQISIIENERQVHVDTLMRYLPGQPGSMLPAVARQDQSAEFSEREILYKVLFDMKRDMMEMKKIMAELMKGQPADAHFREDNAQFFSQIQQEIQQNQMYSAQVVNPSPIVTNPVPYITPVNGTAVTDHEEVEEESLSLEDREKELIIKALEKYRGRRKNASSELGISERTLYRKIKEYGITL